MLPAHEYFHQSMVVADCESELFRDGSRGLHGGAFFVATLLNRKEAKTARGKDNIDSLKDLILLKVDARFCHYYISRNNLDPEVDNTPDNVKESSVDEKVDFLHVQVAEVLRELLPYFKKCSLEDPLLHDHPLQEGRRPKYQPSRNTVRKEAALDSPALIVPEVVEKTTDQLLESLPDIAEQYVEEQYVEEILVNMSGTRSRVAYRCMVCSSFQSRYRTICLSHVGVCLEQFATSNQDLCDANASFRDDISPEVTSMAVVPEEIETEDINDDFWNYKNSEFFVDAIFGVTAVFERNGDGLGCFIINKILLPIFHGLKHSNYSNSVHRYITRILCEATPKEALKLIHERFSNRVGRPGNNIARDRRMEYRIGTAKKLIGNLGPNFTKDAVQQVNSMLDIKEELFLKTRVSHGVSVRSGNHNARSDAQDYALLFSHLSEVQADKKISGRTFGDFKFKDDLMDDSMFDKAEFYRWIATKNKEAKTTLYAKTPS